MRWTRAVRPEQSQPEGQPVDRWLVPTLLTVLLVLASTIAVTTPWDALSAAAPAPDLGAGPVPAEWSRDFTTAEYAAAKDYRTPARALGYAQLGLTLVWLLWVALGSGGARAVRSAETVLDRTMRVATRLRAAAGLGSGSGRSARRGPWSVLVLVLLSTTMLVLSLALLRLPAAYLAERLRQNAGLSSRSWPEFAEDVARQTGLDLLVLSLLVALVVLLARWRPRTWWRWMAPLAAAMVVLGSLLYPILVEPAFNDFVELDDPTLEREIQEMAQDAGVTVDEVLVADASQRTTTLNAYVSGIGATRRVVLYDTLAEDADRGALLQVVAHELAHVREHDVLRGTVVGAGGAAAAVMLLALLTRNGVPGTGGAHRARPQASSGSRVRQRPGRATLGEAAAVPLVVSFAVMLPIVIGPGEATLSRKIETRADVVALDLRSVPADQVEVLRTIALRSLQDLDPPWASAHLFASHPSAPQRIAVARTWALRQGVPVPPDAVRR